MPGPRNARKKRKAALKTQKKKDNPASATKASSGTSNENSPSTASITTSYCSSRSTASPSPTPSTPPPTTVLSHTFKDLEYYTAPHPDSVYDDIRACRDHIEQVMLQPPFIHDPGNGPRVRDARAFLESEFFAQRPALDDPLCAEFAQEEVLQMLMTVLPEETAIILWYNKSRLTSRICPACQRLYRLGDVLPDHTNDPDAESESDSEYEARASKQKPRPPPSPQLEREQELSGLCSPICFILSSFSHPNAIKSAWGCTADEMDDVSWDLLNAPQGKTPQGKVGNALSMLVKMTRLHDLGLAQLCLGENVDDWEEGRAP